MSDPSDDLPLRASDDRFRRGRAELSEALVALLGPRGAPLPLADADRAAALAAEARGAYRDAEAYAWAVVRAELRADDRRAIADLLQAVGAAVGGRPVWLVVPGREPQVVPLAADLVLDNPLGFAALGDHEFTLLDQAVPGGLTVTRHAHVLGAAHAYAWEVEAWGAEPWLSAATRALRERRQRETEEES